MDLIFLWTMSMLQGSRKKTNLQAERTGSHYGPAPTPLLDYTGRHSLPVSVVEAAETDAFDLLVTPAASVTVAVVSKDETGGAAGYHGETTDTALQMERQTGRQ